MLKFEPQYTLFDSVEQMLAPETLSQLLSKSVTRMDCQPINNHGGLAGGRLSYVNTNVDRLVLKQMSITSDWIMFASNDLLCRSITLWQYGLLDQLYPHLAHKIIACAQDGTGWAILMDDLTEHVFTWEKAMAPELVTIFLDALARIHATFWNNPNLRNPQLGLCDPATLLDQSSLPMARKHNGQAMGVIPDWVRGGWEVMAELIESDVFAEMTSLIENPQPLFDALSRYPVTLLHGDYRVENLAYAEHPVAIDWQEATCSLMTIDLAWFVKHGYVRDVMAFKQATQYYRERLEAYLHKAFGEKEWQAMVALGCLVDALRSTCFSAFWYKHSDNLEGKQFNKMIVKQQGQWVQDAMRWL